MKIKTSELVGKALNYAVSKAENFLYKGREIVDIFPEYSTYGSEGIKLMERENISGVYYEGIAAWCAFKSMRPEEIAQTGPTLLIAVCRCFVASKLGDEVDIPEELL